MVGFRANSLPDVIYGKLIWVRMVRIAKSYVGHAREEVLIEEFLGDFVFESRMVGFGQIFYQMSYMGTKVCKIL